MTLDVILAATAVLLILSIFASKASGRLGVPALVLFLALGMLAGSEGIGGIYFDNVHVAERLGVIALAFLLFMVPVPAVALYAMTFPLQSLAAQNAAWALELLGVPVLLDGNVIHLSQVSLGVTEACSGIRSLISLLALAAGLGYLTLSSPSRVAVLVAATVPVSVIANAFRVVSTAFVALWFGIDYATGFFHAFSGWAIFVFASACLLGLNQLLLIGTRTPRSAGH